MIVINGIKNCVLRPQLLHQCYRLPMAKITSEMLFTDTKQSQLYAKFRPTYTEDVYQQIVSFCKEGTCTFNLAVDVACGSGQSTIPLTKHFKQVIGVDVSEQQIANAPSDISNCTFRVSQAEDLSFVQTATVDLVTVAQAFHWVDKKKFFAEVNRILIPGGSLVVYGYGTNKVEPKEAHDVFHYVSISARFFAEVNRILIPGGSLVMYGFGTNKVEPKEAHDVFHYVYEDILGNYWPDGRKQVEEKYSSVTLPYPGWIRDDSLAIVKKCTVADFVGYIGSWSALALYNKTNPSINVLNLVTERLQSICYGNKVPEVEGKPVLTVTWPVFMLLGHKSK